MDKFKDININYDNLKLVPATELPRAKSVPLDDPLMLYKFCRRLQTLCDKANGVGLSAVQVGIPLNVCVVKNNDEYEYLINCSYAGVGDKVDSIEGCLSILDSDGKPRQFELKRFQQIEVDGYILKSDELSPYVQIKEVQKQLYVGFPAIIVQHELDHAVGILISDIGQEIKVW